MILGITGPTGAGKTTALEELKKRGYRVVDCDRLYDGMLERDESLRSALKAAFGEQIFLPDGSLDRRALSATVFGDSRELKKLNDIVFPAVGAEVEKIIAENPTRGVAIDAINLIESGLGEMCDMTVAITAPVQVRAQRIMARDGITLDRAMARINAQKPDKFYRKHCTFLLENRAGSQAEFRRLMGEFFDDILF